MNLWKQAQMLKTANEPTTHPINIGDPLDIQLRTEPKLGNGERVNPQVGCIMIRFYDWLMDDGVVTFDELLGGSLDSDDWKKQLRLVEWKITQIYVFL